MSLRIRKRVEEVFGWMKTVGGFRHMRYRGVERTGLAGYLVATAYNLVRLAKRRAGGRDRAVRMSPPRFCAPPETRAKGPRRRCQETSTPLPRTRVAAEGIPNPFFSSLLGLVNQGGSSKLLRPCPPRQSLASALSSREFGIRWHVRIGIAPAVPERSGLLTAGWFRFGRGWDVMRAVVIEFARYQQGSPLVGGRNTSRMCCRASGGSPSRCQMVSIRSRTSQTYHTQ